MNNNVAYIPMAATAIVAALLFVMLIIIKKRKTARVSFILFLSDLTVLIGSLYAAYKINQRGNTDAVFIFTAVIAAASFLLIPYALMLCTFEPKKFEKLVPVFVNKAALKAQQAKEAAENAIEEKKRAELSAGDETILNISRAFMNQAASSFNDENGMNLLLDYINKTVREETKADGGAILMVDDFEDVIAVKSFDGDFPPPYKLPNDMPHKPIRVATNFKFASFPLRDNLFGEIASSGKAELITKPELDDRIFQNGPEEFLECGSYIIAPMKVEDSVVGLVALSRNHSSPRFTEDDFKKATKLSDFAATAVKNVISVKEIIEQNGITKETDLASHIQNTLRPAKIPPLPGIQVGTIFEQNEGVCGDYYDVIPSRKDRISFVLGDIAGKGINSVIIMTMIRAMTRLVVNTKQTAGTILTWVNKGIASESFSTDHFGSCALINYDPVSHKAEYSTCGTTPVYYFDSTAKTFSCISHTSEPIGVEKASEYKEYVQEIKKGDILVSFSDGIIESLNGQGQQYSVESLLNVIKKNCGSSGKDIANLVKADIQNFCGETEQHDDQTLLVIKF
ncbi:sigma-B regulation protein RsbU (phosphoserine phosphatase) [Treponema rectale]|uniref:Sigma-B regulation protein RsbU (Phosphoserine phosphatase) n=2 Tax=Treponema rectale TaxID=744512 RepID=A0A840SD50_9SPIR|nr:GAF domain-containing SpoIIE family protein phosphatase [Treponema rectale]MBB5218118.1 sigma-B regulation protein RsbU (phosphoserine phosphatase) [Treponema rectale]